VIEPRFSCNLPNRNGLLLEMPEEQCRRRWVRLGNPMRVRKWPLKPRQSPLPVSDRYPKATLPAPSGWRLGQPPDPTSGANVGAISACTPIVPQGTYPQPSRQRDRM